MKSFLQYLRSTLLPRNSKQEKFARLILRKIPALRSWLTNSYRSWIKQNEPDKKAIAGQTVQAESFSYQPLISIVVPVFSPSITILHETIQSVLAQTYQNWELCIVNGDISKIEIGQILDVYSAQDKRIKIKALTNNFGIAENTNAAIEMASGDFVGFLDHDDCLAPFALYEIVSALIEYPETDLFYSDEDYLSEDSSQRYNPVFKPIFSIDYLRAANYMPHFLVIRKELGTRLGWLRQGFDGAQDYDLVLRAIEQARWVTHIPQVLYHWRALPTSTASTVHAKAYAGSAGLRAVREHLERCGLKGIVQQGEAPTLYCIQYEIPFTSLISIIIPNHEHADVLCHCVDSILSKSTYQHYEILIIENNSQSDNIFTVYQQLQSQDKRVRVVEYPNISFNYSEINNFAAGLAAGDIFLFLNNDTQILNSDWLERMLEFAVRPDVGAVGAKLYYPNTLIQHAGIVIGMGVGAGHYFVGYPKETPGYRYNLVVPQNLSAVTAACLMIRKEVFNEIGGFDPDYQLGYGDIDLCLKLRQKDYLIVWTPYAELIHYESMTRGYEDTPQKEARFYREANLLMERWADFFKLGDPYYNPNLTLSRGDFSVRAGVCDHTPRSTKGLLFSKAFKKQD
jgi:GT2 family glycosyltransferase